MFLEGTLVPNTWEDREGVKHAGVKIHAQIIEFLGASRMAGKKGNEASQIESQPF